MIGNDFHKKEGPLLTLPSLGGGSASTLVRKPPSGGGGSLDTPSTNNNLTDDDFVNVMNTSIYADRDFCGMYVDKYNSGKIYLGGNCQAGSVDGQNYGWGYLIASTNQNGTYNWNKKIAFVQANKQDSVYALGGDSSGNVYGFGKTQRADNSWTASMCKLNSSGTLQYGKFCHLSGNTSVGNNGENQFQYVKIDSSSNQYSLLWLDNSSNQRDTYIMKTNSSQSISWQKKVVLQGSSTAFVGSGAYQKILGFDIKYDGSEIYMLFKNNQESNKISVVKFDGSDGSVTWTKTLTASNSFEQTNGGQNNAPHAQANALQVDYSGNVYIATGNSTNFAISKITSSGVLSWSKIIQSNGTNDSLFVHGGNYAIGVDQTTDGRIIASHPSTFDKDRTGDSHDTVFYALTNSGTVSYARHIYHANTKAADVAYDNSGRQEKLYAIEGDGNGMMYLGGNYPSLGYGQSYSWQMHYDSGFIKHKSDTAVGIGSYGVKTSSGFTDSTAIENFTEYTVTGGSYSIANASSNGTVVVSTPSPSIVFTTASQCLVTGSESDSNFDVDTSL